ncbi:hypothetical protein J6TS1_04490 [Siminovitchia terrae]|uniref:Uncharacterized protein n=1 Tax=Siminovitchia terrae TaxID=1914933 RepID=A0ABQ4KRB8_SIMTE|nr:hypothetical protein J22TS1_25350 [Siminovitchia terrae]GIN94579.1 hypothetical protein J6TS1_04490 [Siminovitchia terrae]
MGKRKSSPRLATTSAAMLLSILSPLTKLLYMSYAINHVGVKSHLINIDCRKLLC